MIIESAKANAKNNDQIAIIGQIIDRCQTVDEVNKVCALLASRTKLGLVFDEAPIVRSKDIISVLKKDQTLSFVGTDSESPHHKLILGDNYDALNNLLITHRNCIDVIYIDPPYNTGGSNLGYHDKFSKDAWLNFMKERMLLARELLSNDGVVFVSLDDNMQAYFKVMMDEIFGEENFIANLIWHARRGGGNDAKNIAIDHEYILVYAKNKELTLLVGKPKSHDEFKLEDEYVNERGKYNLQQFDRASLTYTVSLDYPIVAPDSTIIYPGHVTKEEWLKRRENKNPRNDWRWMMSEITYKNALENNFIIFERNESKQIWNVRVKSYQFVNYKGDTDIERLIKMRSILSDDFGITRDGNNRIKDLGLIFSYSKPSELIKNLLSFFKKNDALILDFFAGSGTTGEAVLELNREDGGSREFILCTLEVDSGNNIGRDVCYERLYRINNGIATRGSHEFAWIKDHQPYHNSLDVYRVVEQKIDLNHDLSQIDLQVYNDLNQYKNFKQEDIPFIMNKLLDHLWGKR